MLIDAQIIHLWMMNGVGLAGNRYADFARAIEAAATAPLLERIAELEVCNANLEASLQRFKNRATSSKTQEISHDRIPVDQ